jgi:uncharacterized membrane protein
MNIWLKQFTENEERDDQSMHNTKTSSSSSESLTDYLTNLQTNVGTPERILSSIGGGALIAYGIRRGDALGILAAVLGGALAFRGVSGHCHAYDAVGLDTSEKSESNRSPYHKGLLDAKIHVKKSVTIDRSPAELYQFWRNFENLPQFMRHLESVTILDEKRSRWKAKAPLGTTVEWDAELSSDVENERIGWKSAENASVPNSGVVLFKPTSNRGTVVEVTMIYEPPAGKLGALVAKLFGEEPNQQVAEDLRRFKQLMESGEIITVEGQPSGREPAQQPHQQQQQQQTKTRTAQA